MSVQEIIEAIPTLTTEELRQVEESVQQRTKRSLQAKTSWGRAMLEIAGTVELPPDASTNYDGLPRSSWGKALQPLAGSVPDLPSDLAKNHDHYLYGSPKVQ